MSTITNTCSTIDSRDIIARIEELEILLELEYSSFLPCVEELGTLRRLIRECEYYAEDSAGGITLIHRNYFEEYMNAMAEEYYDLPKDLPFWMSIQLDYDALKQDYTSVDFDGEEYLIR